MKRFLQLECRDIVLVVALSMFMLQLDSAVLVIALPEIARDFDVPVVSLSLSITIYLTTLVAALPISGWAADRFGARRVFLLATVGFAGFSLVCAMLDSFWPFILARAFQGGCASLLASIGRLILLQRTRKDEVVDAMAITTMPMLIAPTIGPSLGGFIVEHASWQYIFLLNIPFALLLILLTRLKVAEGAPDKTRKLDGMGAALFSITLIALLTGFGRLVDGLGRPLPWILIGGGAVLAWITVRHLKTHPHPIVALDAMRSRMFRCAAVGAGAMVRLPHRAVLFMLPLMFQIGFGFSPFIAGLMLMALNGGDLISKPAIRPAFDRFGFKQTVVLSNVLGLAGLAAMLFLEAGPWTMPLILFGLLLAGISRSLVFTGMVSLSYVTLNERVMTSGNVLASISMQLFNVVAISATALVLSLSTWANGRGEPQLGDFRIAMLVVIAVGLVSTVALWRSLPRDLEEIHGEVDT